jgi:hypothetical protein|tara:strand:+ start:7952 stop:8140 length:189 start_codon:yes stop_codon:yes gene_type:complete
MSRADFLNKERWDAQRNTTIGSKLDRIIDLLEKLTSGNIITPSEWLNTALVALGEEEEEGDD